MKTIFSSNIKNKNISPKTIVQLNKHENSSKGSSAQKRENIYEHESSMNNQDEFNLKSRGMTIDNHASPSNLLPR